MEGKFLNLALVIAKSQTLLSNWTELMLSLVLQTFIRFSVQFSSLSCVWLFVTPWIAARQASLSITNSRSLLKLMSVELVMPSNHLILCRPLLPRLQSFPASGSFPMSQFFASDGQSIGVSASASVLPMNIQDWFPLGWTGWVFLLSKGLKSLLQHHSSKALILQCSVSVSNWIWIFRVHRSSLCWWNVFGGPGQNGNWSYRYGWLYTAEIFSFFLPSFLFPFLSPLPLFLPLLFFLPSVHLFVLSVPHWKW